MSFINPDTGWLGGFDGGSNSIIYITTNGGVTFQNQFTQSGGGIARIFFLKQPVGNQYYGWCSEGSIFRKTTNSGVSWTQVGAITASREIFFINKDTGWVSNGGMFKSTDGGSTWINQPMPSGSEFTLSSMYYFVIINKDTIYGVGGERYYGGSQARGIIWASTNSGSNWGYQQPDTSIHNSVYSRIDYSDSLNGWAYIGPPGVHTTNGGGIIIFVGIDNNNKTIPKTFTLSQNYPNPFNPQTTIEFSISKSSYITLTIYDITGKEVIKIYNNEFLSTGNYKTVLDFSKNSASGVLSSGVYFYELKVIDDQSKQLFKETKKLIYAK
jgi:photosystem II stability/assembly factor-like uncharacterized protein